MRNGTPAGLTATSYLELLQGLLQALDVASVLRIGAILERARELGGSIFIAGNGGSAATSSHWANDLGKAARRQDARPIRVVSLGDHLSWVSALANDEGYSRIFAGQLENLAEPGDVLVVLSASGNSANLIEAVTTAQSMGVTAVGFLGFDGGVLKTLLDDCVWVPSAHGAYGPVEDVHHVICHLLATCLGKGIIDHDTALADPDRTAV